MTIRLALLSLLLASFTLVDAQKQYKVICVGFYNFENLFDTEDHPDKQDSEFTPEGSNHYTEDRYQTKLENLSEVVSKMGTEVTPHGPAILGVCEIENRKVLEDFVLHPNIVDRNYQIVHFESPDRRGIDNALLYQEEYFKVTRAYTIPMPTRISDGDTSYSRDILTVHGTIDDEPVVILVNHWPSRRGGEKATAPLRNRAAEICRMVVDSANEQGIKSIVMGDLNDDPVNTSVSEILRARPSTRKLRSGDMYNPFYDFYKRGMGTTAYQDAWSLFDQIILSHQWVRKTNGFEYYKARVFNEPWLTQRLGHFKGYPFRTYGGGTWLGGYSDHFPVYVFLVKERE